MYRIKIPCTKFWHYGKVFTNDNNEGILLSFCRKATFIHKQSVALGIPRLF